jgi:hypothetical protein
MKSIRERRRNRHKPKPCEPLLLNIRFDNAKIKLAVANLEKAIAYVSNLLASPEVQESIHKFAKELNASFVCYAAAIQKMQKPPQQI